MIHPYNRAWEALLPLKKSNNLYKSEDIKDIETTVNNLLVEFSQQGFYTFISAGNLNVVQAITINFKPISINNSYVDMETIEIKLLT